MEFLAQSNPSLVFTKLQQHVPVSVAGPSTCLKAMGIMQVPITWENGRQATFTMLVVPKLSWPILLGQNHLYQTDAHIYSKALKVHFADLSINFTIKCYASNPLSSFPPIHLHGT